MNLTAEDLEPLLLAENVQVTNGGVSVMITFPVPWLDG
jgi:hypothetical protein